MEEDSGELELPGKRSGDVADEPAAKRGRANTAEPMDAGTLTPTFGLEILRCDEDLGSDAGKHATDLQAIDLDEMNADIWEASDDVKGGALDPKGVMSARAKELE